MFKLRRLEITGFKSFADHTDLIFTGDGITGIVGPNGCGKSNVADAIAWVLGEQRVKHLRGGEMKDVIFQGSRNRPPSGMSEVVLHLERDEVVEHEPDIEDIDSTLEQIDEHAAVFAEVEPVSEPETVSEPRAVATGSSDCELKDSSPAAPNPQSEIPDQQSDDPVATAPGSVTEGALEIRSELKSKAQHHRHWRRRNLALEFAPGEAVSVTRRLYRSGESEYLLNDRACRLRDIQDLFSGTGLSGGHYAIIEQGRIGQILSAKPMDRRTIIEEAAGITKFRVRQRAAEARLESARAGIDLRLYQSGMSHLKAMLIDDEYLIAGSSNFDYLSYRIHQELMGIFTAPELIADFQLRVMLPDLTNSVGTRCKTGALGIQWLGLQRKFVDAALTILT